MKENTCRVLASCATVLLLCALARHTLAGSVLTVLAMLGIPVLAGKTPKELGFVKPLRGTSLALAVSATTIPLYCGVCYTATGTFNVNIYPVLQLPAVVAEEVFFRSYLYSELAPLLASCWKVNIASSFVFALAHVVAYRSVLMFKVFLPSLLMGWLYQKRRTIAPPVLFHWLANTAYLLFPCGV